MIPGLAQLSIGQKVLGAVLSLAIWLAPAAGVWLYMHGQLSAQYALGKAEAEKTCAKDNAFALTAAIEGAAATQAVVNAQAQRDAQQIIDTLGAARKDAARISKEFQSYALENPLPADCRADPVRVRLYNETRRGQAARP